ncbi:hypothetical protein KQH41_00290 [bacterium]|nr:hypothetical protein [bacterium]
MEKTLLRSALTVVAGVVLCWPYPAAARVNVLTTGVGLSYNIVERQYDDTTDDPATEVDESAGFPEEDDYRRIILTPLVLLTSSSERDTFELRLAPDLQYDFLESDSDWAGSAGLSFERFVTQTWQLGIENTLLRADYYRTDEAAGGVIETVPAEPELGSTEPELSPNIGRNQFWRNSLSLFSEHGYGQDSLVRFGFGYIVLRNDDDLLTEVEDYDRYEVSLINEHRFSPRWATAADLRFIRGIFDDPVVFGEEPDLGETLSDDLWEYRGTFALENNSIERNPLTVSYFYILTRYDETLRRDFDIHQMRLTWRRDYSSRLYTSIGAGPTFITTEGQDDEWDANGLAEINYLLERGALNFQVEKGFDSVDFGGDEERGLVDFWEARFTASYALTPYLSVAGRLSYLYEDRTDPLAALAADIAGGEGGPAADGDPEEYHNDRYLAGVTLNYLFMEDYTAGIDYSYMTQDSDRRVDSYDEHRLLLTISWETEVLRW